MKITDDTGRKTCAGRWTCAIGATALGVSLAAFAADDQAVPRTDLTGCAVSVAGEVPRDLPGLKYECMALRQGSHILVGTAGPAGSEAVLLVHGLGNNAHRDFSNTIPELSERYRVVTLDLPGFGASAALPQGYSFETLGGVLTEVLDRQNVTRAHIVGHSLGGAVALFFAHAHPERTDRLVLIDAAGILLKSVYVHHVSKITTPQLGVAPVDRLLDKIDDRINGLNRHITYRLESKFDFSQWLAENPSVRVPLLGRFTQADAALGLIEHDFTRAIRETAAPTTVIWGRNDDVSPVRVGDLLAARLPNARLHVMERIGHVPMSESPREFNTLLLDSLRATVPPVEQTNTATAADATCRNESEQAYTGRIATLVIDNCRDVHIQDATLTKLVIVNSSAVLKRVSIDGAAVALEAKNSFITATAMTVTASGIGLSVDDSQLDLAGTSIRAGTRGIRMPVPSRIYFSVSDMQAPEYSGDLHKIVDREMPAAELR